MILHYNVQGHSRVELEAKAEATLEGFLGYPPASKGLRPFIEATPVAYEGGKPTLWLAECTVENV